MATQTLADKTVCVGAFNTVAKADRAVREALEAGFSREQVGVDHHHFRPPFRPGDLEKCDAMSTGPDRMADHVTQYDGKGKK